MPQVTVTVLIEVDGQPVSGFPLTARYQTDQVVPWNPYTHAANAADVYVAVPASTVTGLQALVLKPTGPIRVRFAGQTDAGLAIQADGLLVAVNCDVTSGSATNVTVHADADVAIRGLAAGSHEV